MTASVELLPALTSASLPVPALIADAGQQTSEHFLEFFAASLRNRNTRAAYVQATAQFFAWCEERQLHLHTIRPLHVAAYIEGKQTIMSAPSIKQHLAGLRSLFNWLVVKQAVPSNPVLFVKGPRFSREVGVTPILEPAQMRALLDSLASDSLKSLRDRAIIAVMGYTFARVSAVAGLRREDYSLAGKRPRLRLHEKGGKEKIVWPHHQAEEYLDAYLEATGPLEAKAPLFPSVSKNHHLTGNAMSRTDMLRMVKNRCLSAGLPPEICNHTFRGTGITVFLQNGGALEAAQGLAGHSDPRTTKLYDRRKDLATLSEIERRIAY
jgi:site-specific recombinase XerD